MYSNVFKVTSYLFVHAFFQNTCMNLGVLRLRQVSQLITTSNLSA